MALSSKVTVRRDFRLLFIILAIIFYVLTLISYDPNDSAWSIQGSALNPKVANWGGVVGAWLADISYYLFGYSVWWIFFGIFVWSVAVSVKRHAIRFNKDIPLLRPKLRSFGFVTLLIFSCSFEYLGNNGRSGLPLYPGGLLGGANGSLMYVLLGFYAALILSMLGIAIGLSILLQISWLNVVEKLGQLCEDIVFYILYRIEYFKDKTRGAANTVKREKKVRAEKRSVPNVIVTSPVLEETKTKKVIHKKEFAQAPLFTEEQTLPHISLLNALKVEEAHIDESQISFTSQLIERKLSDFRVKVNVIEAQPGPVITRYEIEPDKGVKGSQVVNLATDLARALSLPSIRVVETIPGKKYMGLELPNGIRKTVQLTEIMQDDVYQGAKSLLTLVLGQDIAGKPVVADLAKMPHLLVAGTTGSGKSVGINAMILSLLFRATPDDVRLIMIDPKMLEMSIYEGIGHLIAPVVTDMRQAANALNWCVGEMERRYKLMSKMGVRNLTSYNQKLAKEGPIANPFSLTPENPEPLEHLPNIVIFIDELADLMMVAGKKIEELIARIAQKARAAGMHLVLATQRPSVDVITGLIKANIPTRISFQVSSKIDSRTILDQMGAESLLGMGDMLYLPAGSGFPIRVHGAFVADEEVHRVVEFIKSKGEPCYVDGILEGTSESVASSESDVINESNAESDPLYDEAVAIVLKSKRASISFVQQKLRIGYNRSARILEQMEASGIVSPMKSNGQRQIIVPQNND